MKRNNLNHLVDIAIDAAKLARNLVLGGGFTFRDLEDRQGREWKIVADRQVEQVLINYLQENSGLSILSEERGQLEGKGELKWILDPLDGSANFHRGIPLNCISIGLWEQSDPVAGVILDLQREELFTGIIGEGAWCNERKICVNTLQDPSHAVLCTGFPAAFRFDSDSLNRAFRNYEKFGKVRMLGSAALMLAWVAYGRCDCYWETRIALWDVAAGLAVVKAADGVIDLGTLGSDHRLDVIASSNPEIQAAIS